MATGDQYADNGMPQGVDNSHGHIQPRWGDKKNMISGSSLKPDVSTTSMSWNSMKPKWDLISTVAGGTATMRWAGEKYLPKHQYEAQDPYNERLSRATLKNYTLRTLENLTSKAFRDAPKFNPDVPQQILDLATDIDAEGADFSIFTRAWFRMAVERSFAFVLVDHSNTAMPAIDGIVVPRTKADDAKQNVRPFWRLVDPMDVIYMRLEKVDGNMVLAEVRIKELEVVSNGWTDTYIEHIRVLRRGLYEVWEKRVTRKGAKPVWIIIESGEMGLDYIPLVSFYTSQMGLAEGKPPLEDLAYLNVEHFQSSADQRAILTVARFPILAVSGATNNDPNGAPILIGPKQWLSVADPQGRIYYVEHAGKAIEAGRIDLEDLEDQMASYGSEFLRKRPGASSATGRALDSAEAISALMAWGMDFKSAIEQALKYTADWLKLGSGGTVAYEIKADISVGESKELDVLDRARARKDISRITLLEEFKRRSMLSAEFDEKKDQEQLDAEPVVDAQGFDMTLSSTTSKTAPKGIPTVKGKPGPARTTGEPPVTTA